MLEEVGKKLSKLLNILRVWNYLCRKYVAPDNTFGVGLAPKCKIKKGKR